MSDAPPDRDPEAHGPGFGRGFGLSFGLCAVPPLLLYAVVEAIGTSSDVSLVFVLMPAMLGLGMLVFGVTQMVRGNRAGGGGLILGALAGFIVGFSLCLGTFTLGPMN